MANSSLKQRYMTGTVYENWIPATLKEKHELRKLNQILLTEGEDKNLEVLIQGTMEVLRDNARFDELPVLKTAYSNFLGRLNDIRKSGSVEDSRKPLIGKWLTKAKEWGKSHINSIKGYWLQLGSIEEFSSELNSFFEETAKLLSLLKIPDDKKDKKISEIIASIRETNIRSSSLLSEKILDDIRRIITEKKGGRNRLRNSRSRAGERRSRPSSTSSTKPEPETPGESEETEDPKGEKYSREAAAQKLNDPMSFEGFFRSKGGREAQDFLINSFKRYVQNANDVIVQIDQSDDFPDDEAKEKEKKELIEFAYGVTSSEIKELSIEDEIQQLLLNSLKELFEATVKNDDLAKVPYKMIATSLFSNLNDKLGPKWDFGGESRTPEEDLANTSSKGKLELSDFKETLMTKASKLFVKGVFEKDQQSQLIDEVMNLSYSKLVEIVEKMKGSVAQIASGTEEKKNIVAPAVEAVEGAPADGKKTDDKTEKGTPGAEGKPGEEDGKSPGKGSPTEEPSSGGDKGSKVISVYKKALEKEGISTKDMDEDQILNQGAKTWKKKLGKNGTKILKFLISQGLIK